MNAGLLHSSILLLCSILLVDRGQALAQGRTSGRTRDGGRVAEAVTRTPPASEGTSRTVGRTRTAETTVTTVPASDSPRRLGRTEPQQQAPSLVDPVPQPEHSSSRPPHIEDRPLTIIVVEDDGGACVVAPVEVGRSDGTWIRDGIRFGKDVTLASLASSPEYSGYDFSELLKRPFDHPYTDVCVEEDTGDLMMSVWEDSEIMDLGSVLVPSDVIYIPRQDWSPNKKVLLVLGHEYVVRTWDHHYAKFFVTSLLQDRVSFDWAYQYARDDQDPVLVVRSSSRFQR